jgi:hypothetical protein
MRTALFTIGSCLGLALAAASETHEVKMLNRNASGHGNLDLAQGQFPF